MKSHQFQQALAGSIILIGLPLGLMAEEWTRFRGPNGAGLSNAKSIPTTWTDQAVNWKVELPGVGHSSPVVWRDRIFVTSAEEHSPTLYLHCINVADGRLVWKKTFALGSYGVHRFNNFASSTPAVDAAGVYLAFRGAEEYELRALSHSGEARWRQGLGAFVSQHGNGGSPIVAEGLVILAKDQDGESFIAAYQAEDGKRRWQTPLAGKQADYGTPCLYPDQAGTPLLIFNSMEDGVTAFRVNDGKIAWQLAKVFSQRCVSSPVIASGLIVGSCGSGGGGNYVAAVRPPAAGGTQAELVYTMRKSAPYVPTSVAVGGLLFLWGDGGVVSCLDGSNGAVKWQERVGGNFFASPVCVDRRLFGVSTSGEVVVLDASEHFQVLSRHQLQEATHATPAVSEGRMYLRTVRHLISIGRPEMAAGGG